MSAGTGQATPTVDLGRTYVNVSTPSQLWKDVPITQRVTAMSNLLAISDYRNMNLS
jgi:hypothetical protein